MLFIIIIFISLIFNYNNTMNSIYDSLEVWLFNVYPSLFLLYIISYYFIHNKLFNKISLILKPFISFEYNKSYAIMCTGFFLGNPGTITLAYNAFSNNHISLNDYKKLVYLSIFMNPLFILSFFNKIIFVIYFISSFFTLFIFDKFMPLKKRNVDSENANYTYKVFLNSINSIINVLLVVACISVLCNVLKTSISFLLYKLNLNFDLPLSFLEIGTGLKYLTNKNMLYAPIFLISFQGLCIIIQSFSLIKNLNISFFKYLLLRILESITTTLIFFLIYSCFSSSANELFNHF